MTDAERTYRTYTVQLTNRFDAVCAEDAVLQFVTWAQENAHAAGYRVEWDESCILAAENLATEDDCSTHRHEVVSVFIDADDLSLDDPEQLERYGRSDLCDGCRSVDHRTCSLDPTCSCCRDTIAHLNA